MKNWNLARAKKTWGESLPDWIEALAMQCDTANVRVVAEIIGMSPAAISLINNNKYAPRCHKKAEQRIRATLMARAIECPVLGDITLKRCQDEQAAPLVTCNPVSVQLYRACRGGCRFSEKG